MSTFPPIETLFDASAGERLPLPEILRAAVGPIRVTIPRERPLVIGNVVTTLDGVTSLGDGPSAGGSEISGGSMYDRALMGMLRALSDVVVVGAGTIRATPRHLWTPESACPSMAEEYDVLRHDLGKEPLPHRVAVTASGNLDLRLPFFLAEPRPTLILTTASGQRRVRENRLSDNLRVIAQTGDGPVTARAIVDQALAVYSARIILVEGGPQLFGQFIREKMLDELFVTLAPQIAGRDADNLRPGLVAGVVLAPLDSRWATLMAVKRGDSHLFLRYRFTFG